MSKTAVIFFGIFFCVIGVLGFVIYSITYHPNKVQKEAVNCPADTPVIMPDQFIKILNWNIQYMAGKNYTFFYDVPNDAGPDVMPKKEDIDKTFKEVARVIKEENPDIVILQEMNDGAKASYYEDQLKILKNLIPKEYKCSTSTFYFKSDFVPHPKILGSVGRKLVTLSKYKITDSTRYALPEAPRNWFIETSAQLLYCDMIYKI